MESLNIQFNLLNSNLSALIEDYKNLKAEKENLIAELNLKSDKLNHSSLRLKELENEIKQLKMVNAMSGNEEYRRIMKLQLNKLIKEIDICMSQLTHD